MFEGAATNGQELAVNFSGPRRRTLSPVVDGPDLFAARSPAGRRDPMSAFELASRGTVMDLGA
ncbi:MAG: hypothetical protein RLO51_23705 [Thalassobaculum sp.]|uniref:hypothetical protein n=1 Tax=Thalassobaculum sp. TaxID=2022740 RepID=UPI0032EF9846